MVVKISKVDVIGRFFIIPPFLLITKKKDVRVDTEHPLLQILLLQKHLWHIRLFRDTHSIGRANLVCNGT